MILFSTILNINDSLTKDAFVALVLEWNRTSKYIENVVPNVDLNGSYSGKFGDAKLSLEFVDDPEKDLMAVRHEKVTADAVVWDTDYVVNFDEKKISIRLDRTYSEDALVINGAFSTPHFITLLIEGGYLEDDQDLPVLRTPMPFAGDMETLSGKYRLPVVHVTKTSDGQDAIDTSWLASKLKGAAHVLVETEKAADTDEFGSVTIFYPSEILPKKRIVYRSAKGNLNARLERVVKLVIQYWNAQTIGLLYTWQGVNNAVLSDSFNRQMVRYQETEKARQQAEEEKDLVYEAFDEDLRKMQQRIDELTKANEALMLENSFLRAKLNVTDAMPIVYQGEEEDFYPDEIKDMILGALDEVRTNSEATTRRADILDDILHSNEYQHLSEQRKQRVKAMFKGYKNVSSAMKQELMDLGMTISDDGKHYKLTYRDDPRYMVTIGKTPSDNRAGNNNAALINKIML